jgi:hypothetical protein
MLALADLAVELVDQAQAGLDRCSPRLGQVESGEQLARRVRKFGQPRRSPRVCREIECANPRLALDWNC